MRTGNSALDRLGRRERIVADARRTGAGLRGSRAWPRSGSRLGGGRLTWSGLAGRGHRRGSSGRARLGGGCRFRRCRRAWNPPGCRRSGPSRTGPGRSRRRRRDRGRCDRRRLLARSRADSIEGAVKGAVEGFTRRGSWCCGCRFRRGGARRRRRGLSTAERLAQPASHRGFYRRGGGFNEFTLFAQPGENIFTADTEFFSQLVYAGLTCHYIS